MEWSGRAPAPPASDAGMGRVSNGAPPCPTKSIATVATMGIDIGKNSFHVVGLDQRGAIVLRQKWSRGQIETRIANMPATVPDWHGSLRWRPSSEPQAASTRSRCATDAGEICARVFQRAEKRFPRRGSDCRGCAAPDDEIRRHQDGRCGAGDRPKPLILGCRRRRRRAGASACYPQHLSRCWVSVTLAEGWN